MTIPQDVRRLYLGQATSSMHAYCTSRLGLSAAAAFKRIHAARLARRFPTVLKGVSSGRLHLSGLTVLGPKLTEGNHRSPRRRDEQTPQARCPQSASASRASPASPAAGRPALGAVTASPPRTTSGARTGWRAVYVRRWPRAAVRGAAIPRARSTHAVRRSRCTRRQAAEQPHRRPPQSLRRDAADVPHGQSPACVNRIRACSLAPLVTGARSGRAALERATAVGGGTVEDGRLRLIVPRQCRYRRRRGRINLCHVALRELRATPRCTPPAQQQGCSATACRQASPRHNRCPDGGLGSRC